VTAVLAFLGGPIGRWLVIGAIALAAAFAWGEKRNASGYERGINKGYAEMKAREDAWLAAMARKQTNLNALTKDFDKRTAELEGKLQGKEAERLAALKKLRERIPNVQACAGGGSLSTGYILFRDDAARWANDGGDPPAATAGADAAGAPSTVSSAELAEVDLGQAAAFRACKERNDAWRQYAAEVEVWSSEVNKVLGSP
jgi:hypothetical protein